MKINNLRYLSIFAMSDDGGDDDSSLLPGGGAGGGSDGNDGNNDGGDGDPSPWSYADGVTGSGEAPEWYKADKYKSVADQAAAYTDLEKKFGGFTGAPEGDYEVTMPEGVEGDLTTDDPLLKGFIDLARESNMSQDTFTKVLHNYIQNEHDSLATDKAAEMEALGRDANTRLQNLADWGQKHLSAEAYEEMRAQASTANGVKFIEEMIAKTRESAMPKDTDTKSNSGMTAESLKDMRYAKTDEGELKINVDPAYKKKVDQAYKDFYGEEPKKQVVG